MTREAFREFGYTPATLQLVLGFGLGYLIATVAESFFHRHIGHASPRTIRFWRRHRWFFAPFLRAYFSHRMVHHTWTYQTDFVTQFRDEAEKREVDQRTPADYRAYIHKHDYGNTLRGFSVVRFVLPTAPAIPAVWLLFGPWVALGSMAPAGTVGYRLALPKSVLHPRTAWSGELHWP